jgi:hypothetical protein
MYTSLTREFNRQEWQVTSETHLRGHISAVEGSHPTYVMVAIRKMTLRLCGMSNVTAGSDAGPISNPFSSLLKRFAGNLPSTQAIQVSQPMSWKSYSSDVGAKSL